MNIASERTKKVLAKVLISLMEERDFPKITIADVVNKAGINRKTFYYHFHSTKELLEWIVNNESIELAKKYDIRLGFDSAIDFVMNYIEKNQKFLRTVEKGVGDSLVRDFIYNNLYPAIFSQITASHKYSQEDDIQFLAEFYTEAATGILQKWLEKPTLRSRKETTECLKSVLTEKI